MTEKFKKWAFFSLLIVTHLLLSYYYFGKWWNSSLGTLLIVGICYAIWRKEFLLFSGLKLKIKSSIFSVIFAGIIVFVSFWMMSQLASAVDVKIEFTGWKNAYHDVFYTLNEEIVFGSVVLFSLVRQQKVHPLMASLGLALVFSLAHFIFYKWVFLEKGILEISTMASLFFITVFRNNLILHTGHIAYSWALHFGWMVIMFGCQHINLQNKTGLSELTRFNLYLGSNAMVAVTLLLAVASLFFMNKNHQYFTKQNTEH